MIWRTRAWLPIGAAIATGAVLVVILGARPAVSLLSDPVRFEDCIGNAADCCNPICKSSISACCFANGCGLPVREKVFGKAGFGGLSAKCSSVFGNKAKTQSPAKR